MTTGILHIPTYCQLYVNNIDQIGQAVAILDGGNRFNGVEDFFLTITLFNSIVMNLTSRTLRPDTIQNRYKENITEVTACYKLNVSPQSEIYKLKNNFTTCSSLDSKPAVILEKTVISFQKLFSRKRNSNFNDGYFLQIPWSYTLF